MHGRETRGHGSAVAAGSKPHSKRIASLISYLPTICRAGHIMPWVFYFFYPLQTLMQFAICNLRSAICDLQYEVDAYRPLGNDGEEHQSLVREVPNIVTTICMARGRIPMLMIMRSKYALIDVKTASLVHKFRAEWSVTQSSDIAERRMSANSPQRFFSQTHPFFSLPSPSPWTS